MSFNPLENATRLTSCSQVTDRWEAFDAEGQLLSVLTDVGAAQLATESVSIQVEFEGMSYALSSWQKMDVEPHADKAWPEWDGDTLKIYRPAPDVEANTLNAFNITSGSLSVASDLTVGGSIHTMMSSTLSLNSQGDVEIESQSGSGKVTFRDSGMQTYHQGMHGIVQVKHGAVHESELAEAVTSLELEVSNLKMQLEELLRGRSDDGSSNSCGNDA